MRTEPLDHLAREVLLENQAHLAQAVALDHLEDVENPVHQDLEESLDHLEL